MADKRQPGGSTAERRQLGGPTIERRKDWTNMATVECAFGMYGDVYVLYCGCVVIVCLCVVRQIYVYLLHIQFDCILLDCIV